jgi:3-keto-disaccharide hydrolase
MRRSDSFGNATLAATLVGLAAFGALLLGQAAAPQPGQATQASAPAVPKPIEPPAPFVPEGFTAIFNGRDLTGWHISSTNHHGTTPSYRVMHGLIVGTQNPLGQGGILLTDKKYKNVEVYIEVKPDYGCDSGLFLRSTEAGEAYQVTLDYLPGGGMGGIYGERLTGVGGRGNAQGAARGAAPAAAPATPPPPPVVGGIPLGSTTPQGTAAWMKAWKREDWNSVRVRFVGDVPHITVWINDQQITDFTDTANHAAGGITEGSIAIQVHGGTRWVPGGLWRWRTIAVKELPADAK